MKYHKKPDQNKKRTKNYGDQDSGVEGGARGVEKPPLPPDQIRIIVRSTETLVPSYISDNAGLTSLISLSEVRDH